MSIFFVRCTDPSHVPVVTTKTDFLPPSPLTDASILGALLDLNTVLSYRLRVKEVVPVQMRSYRIGEHAIRMAETED